MRRLWIKVGRFVGMGWHEFLDTPWDVIEEIEEYIKEVFEDGKSPLSWEEVFTARGINRAFGGYNGT